MGNNICGRSHPPEHFNRTETPPQTNQPRSGNRARPKAPSVPQTLPGFPATRPPGTQPASASRPRRIFEDLNKSAQKMLKFQQRKSLGLLTPQNLQSIGIPDVADHETKGMQNGVCQELATGWLAEKLGAVSTKYFAPRDSRQADTQSPFTGYKTFHDKNAEVALYAAAPAAVNTSRRNVSTAVSFNLRPADHTLAEGLLNPRVGLFDQEEDEPDERPTPPHQALLGAAQRLRPGQGVVATMTLLDGTTGRLLGRHAISMYRAGANNELRFFDPNCGDYRVSDPARFMQDWTNAYAQGRNQRIRFVTAESAADGFQFLQK
jgi:hypothetical protein